MPRSNSAIRAVVVEEINGFSCDGCETVHPSPTFPSIFIPDALYAQVQRARKNTGVII